MATAGLGSFTPAGSLRRSNNFMTRVPSRSSLRRSESAPMLTPLWEPDPEAGGEDAEDDPNQPRFVNSYTQGATCKPRRRSDGCSLPIAPDSNGLPQPWSTLLAKLSAAASTLTPLSQTELMEATMESLREQGKPLRLQTGMLDHKYEMRKLLDEGPHFKVMEGVDLLSEKNFSLKLISSADGQRLRATKALDPMQAFYLICSFVDEVYCHPRYIAIVMKWGMHEVDDALPALTLALCLGVDVGSTRRISSRRSSSRFCAVPHRVRLLRSGIRPHPYPNPNPTQALQLLTELVGSDRARYLRLRSRELQQLLLRSLSLDVYLQTHLFIQ